MMKDIIDVKNTELIEIVTEGEGGGEHTEHRIVPKWATAGLPQGADFIIDDLKGLDYAESKVEIYKRYQALIDLGLTVEEIASHVSLSTIQISRVLTIGDLHPELFEALEEGRLSLGGAERITSVPKAKQARLEEAMGIMVELMNSKEKRNLTKEDIARVWHELFQVVADDMFEDFPEPPEAGENPEYLEGSEAFERGEALNPDASDQFTAGWIDARRS